MSTPSREEVGRMYARAHAQRQWVVWLAGAVEHLDILAVAMADRAGANEPFHTGRICQVRDMLAGTVSDARDLADVWERVARIVAHERGTHAYGAARDAGLSHGEALAAGDAEEAACTP